MDKGDRKLCDRCVRPTKAAATIEIGYGEGRYALDLCDAHASDLDRDMWAWLRLARDVEERPAALQATVLTPAFRAGIAETLTPAPPATPPTSSEPPIQPVAEDEIELYPTHALAAVMLRLGAEWSELVEEVTNPAFTTPNREGITEYWGQKYTVLVAENGAVIGCRRRPQVDPPTFDRRPPPKRIVRRGRRGGAGRVGPRTLRDIVEAIKATPGWHLEMGGKHWKLTGPDGQRSTVPVSPSDWRSPLNVVSELRKIGLDLRATAGK